MSLHPQIINYTNTFRSSLDEKKRVTVPAKWRQEEEQELYCMVHFDNDRLVLMPVETYEKITAQLESNPQMSHSQRQDMIATFSARCGLLTIDKAGRVSLPPEKLSAVGIRRELVMTGGRDRFYVWSPEKHQAEEIRQADLTRQLSSSIGL
ncbi:MAG: hypothetical protein SFY92_08505 [Verrucomicrobiae bacterium]|nr:hypothetical protein [Verrucomicrobiae bacterium]